MVRLDEFSFVTFYLAAVILDVKIWGITAGKRFRARRIPFQKIIIYGFLCWSGKPIIQI
ncbi:hypothetical protein Hanom_Chr04g00343431 [Helianthus anomalus]